MWSSRRKGSKPPVLRVVSASTSISLPSTRKSQGCVLCGDAAKIPARTSANIPVWGWFQSFHGANAAPFPWLKAPSSSAYHTPPPKTRTVVIPSPLRKRRRFIGPLTSLIRSIAFVSSLQLLLLFAPTVPAAQGFHRTRRVLTASSELRNETTPAIRESRGTYRSAQRVFATPLLPPSESQSAGGAAEYVRARHLSAHDASSTP